MADIIVGYDGSECGKAALAASASLAKELGDRVVVVFSYDVNRVGGEVQDMATALRERGMKVLEEATEQTKDAGIDLEAELLEDRPADALAELAKERKARMIVVGTFGDSPIKGAILGSTPHKLLHISDIPVLVVPA